MVIFFASMLLGNSSFYEPKLELDWKLEVVAEDRVKKFDLESELFKIILPYPSSFGCEVNKPIRVLQTPLIVARNLECKSLLTGDRFTTRLICDSNATRSYSNFELYDSKFKTNLQFLFSCNRNVVVVAN